MKNKYNFSDNIEKGILYLLKTHKEAYVELVQLVKPEYFQSEIHENIYKAIIEYNERYGYLPSDDHLIQTLKDTFGRDEVEVYTHEIEQINCIDPKSIESSEFYYDQVEKFAKKQALMEAIITSAKDIQEGHFSDIPDRIKDAFAVSRQVDLGLDLWTDFDARWDRTSDQQYLDKNILPTAFPSLNEVIEGGGLARGELGIVVGAANGGKSPFLNCRALDGFLKGFKIAHVTLELSKDKIAQRYDTQLTLIPMGELKLRREEVKAKLKKRYDQFKGDIKIKEFLPYMTDVNDIRVWLNQLATSEGFIPDIIIVDYMDLMSPTIDGLRDDKAQERIGHELRALGKEYNCFVWTGTQCNREGKKAKLITSAEVADSYGKERACDIMVSLNQSDEEHKAGICRLYIMKNRNPVGRGSRFIIQCHIDYNIMHMSEIKQDEEEPNIVEQVNEELTTRTS